MQVYCHTNLDLAYEVWPTELPCLPSVEHEIMSQTVHERDFQLCLQVCAIRWEYSRGVYIPRIELHMTNFQKGLISKDGKSKGSIIAFYEWYGPLVGRSVHSFI